MGARNRARGSLFRRGARAGNPEACWSIAWRVGGRRYTERAYPDKAASEQLLAQRLREVARDETGLGDPFRRHRARPLSEHLADFLVGIASRRRTGKHVNLTRARLQRAFNEMGARTIGDLDLAKAEQFLAGLLDTSSVKTRDHYALSLRQFGAWLLDTERTGRNVFHKLRGVYRPADASRERLALTAAQVVALQEAAEIRPVAKYRECHPQSRPETLARLALEGRRRGILYLFSAMTGLRSAECAAIRWADLELGADAWVTPRASTTKSKRREPLPLDPRLAELLAGLRKELGRRTGRVPPPAEPVFQVGKNLVEQLRKDAEYAKVPVIDEDGRRLDFHALRATCATLMARAGVPMQMARRLMRHSTPAMTAKHYEKLTREDLRAGSQQMASDFWKQALTATVTASETPNAAQRGTTGRTAPNSAREASS